ncbi:hypothetical protein BDK51DRAFT_32035 [Blyttiomyces helicus]|uniref:Uncharacterized protein n=1 Tax=Blyttiomyces helicus TaxID=388810 RepID=A0A4P9W198_9FUNG|nr:hypothetical protein BDK51DRAFT_32035 [Blyttiomyces helicus]|eukprot:RKO85951.1 hypothetical protein BDK51DRAFT_32035 [Blyttiomyces helicus]
MAVLLCFSWFKTNGKQSLIKTPYTGDYFKNWPKRLKREDPYHWSPGTIQDPSGASPGRGQVASRLSVKASHLRSSPRLRRSPSRSPAKERHKQAKRQSLFASLGERMPTSDFVQPQVPNAGNAGTKKCFHSNGQYVRVPCTIISCMFIPGPMLCLEELVSAHSYAKGEVLASSQDQWGFWDRDGWQRDMRKEQPRERRELGRTKRRRLHRGDCSSSWGLLLGACKCLKAGGNLWQRGGKIWGDATLSEPRRIGGEGHETEGIVTSPRQQPGAEQKGKARMTIAASKVAAAERKSGWCSHQVEELGRKFSLHRRPPPSAAHRGLLNKDNPANVVAACYFRNETGIITVKSLPL